MSEHESTREGRFNSIEIRVLGSLIEKQATSPETYPLTLNALVLACNQKTSREPVMNLSPARSGRPCAPWRTRRWPACRWAAAPTAGNSGWTRA